jgi:hypothetical protein
LKGTGYRKGVSLGRLKKKKEKVGYYLAATVYYTAAVSTGAWGSVVVKALRY